MSDAQDKLSAAIAELGLTVESTFVPFSQSRNRGEKTPSLNWRVTLSCNGRSVLVTDYMAGAAHAPSYRQTFGAPTQDDRDRNRAVAWECENGRRAPGLSSPARRIGPATISPDTVDVIWSLIQDASALDAGGFEAWASDYGYDTDSRKAESLYRQCLDLALKIRAAIGEEGIAKLREAGEDY